jgi:riboflavin kinase/FMN adenylyltransferase
MKRTVVALGNFDGVHLGHQRIIKDAVAFARRKRLPALAITFNPHPQQYIVPQRGLKLLTTLSERRELLLKLGIDRVVVIKFTKALQNLSSQDFVRKILAKKLRAAFVFVGFDYAFGHKRQGEVRHLRKLGQQFKFAVKVVRPVKQDHKAIKSSLIRNLITQGNFNRAVHLLGHPYQLTGKVIRGTGRGRTLGFPTANLRLDFHKLIPHHGVYLGRVGKRRGVVNIGARPTFGAGKVAVEVHILNFSKQLYGQILRVQLMRKIREELQFSDTKELSRQIRKDIAICRSAVL